MSRLWRRPDFRKLWAGQTVSRADPRVSLLAVPLTTVGERPQVVVLGRQCGLVWSRFRLAATSA